MARLARVVLPGQPHHIIQRGNRRQDVFFQESDYEFYLGLLKEWCAKEGVEIWSYCLMTNHIHLIVRPGVSSRLAKAIGEVHRRYTNEINRRNGWSGYLWQGRFSSYPMSEEWLLRAAAYVELNPVAAGMVDNAWDYRWSSVHAYLAGCDSQGIVTTEPLLSYVSHWSDFLMGAMRNVNDEIIKHESTGRPLGGEVYVEQAGLILGRDLLKKKPGPKT